MRCNRSFNMTLNLKSFFIIWGENGKYCKTWFCFRVEIMWKIKISLRNYSSRQTDLQTQTDRNFESAISFLVMCQKKVSGTMSERQFKLFMAWRQNFRTISCSISCKHFRLVQSQWLNFYQEINAWASCCSSNFNITNSLHRVFHLLRDLSHCVGNFIKFLKTFSKGLEKLSGIFVPTIVHYLVWHKIWLVLLTRKSSEYCWFCTQREIFGDDIRLNCKSSCCRKLSGDKFLLLLLSLGSTRRWFYEVWRKNC